MSFPFVLYIYINIYSTNYIYTSVDPCIKCTKRSFVERSFIERSVFEYGASKLFFDFFFDLFFDSPLGAVEFFPEVRLRSERCRACTGRGFGASMSRRQEASERGFSNIFRRQEASVRAFSSISRRHEASERAFSSIFDARRPVGRSS